MSFNDQLQEYTNYYGADNATVIVAGLKAEARLESGEALSDEQCQMLQELSDKGAALLKECNAELNRLRASGAGPITRRLVQPLIKTDVVGITRHIRQLRHRK